MEHKNYDADLNASLRPKLPALLPGDLHVSWCLNDNDQDDIEEVHIPCVGLGIRVDRTGSRSKWSGRTKVDGFHPSRGSIAVATAKALRNAWDLTLSLGFNKPRAGWPVVRTPKATYHFGPREDGELHIDASEDALPRKYAVDSDNESDLDCGEGQCEVNDWEIATRSLVRPTKN